MNEETENQEDSPKNVHFPVTKGLQSCEADSPNRCQAVTGQGQCKWKAKEGSQYCEAHGGNLGVEKQRKATLNRYYLSKHKARIGQMGSEDSKNLRDEIGILRVLIEEFMGRMEREQDGLLLYSGRIADLISRLEKVVKSCHQIDLDTGKMLDKNQALQFAEEMSEIITEAVQSSLKKINDSAEIKFLEDGYDKVREIVEFELVDSLIGKIIERLASVNGRADS